MAECPACNHEVATPFFMNVDAWRHFVCHHCKARLEMKPPRFALFAPIMAPLFVLARQGRVFEVIAYVYAFAIMFLVFLESLRPKAQLRRKTPPKPEIRLNIDGPSN